MRFPFLLLLLFTGYIVSAQQTASAEYLGFDNRNYLGTTVAITADGGTIVIGEPVQLSGDARIYIYEQAGDGSWPETPVATFIPGSSGDTELAAAISADGTVLAIGDRKDVQGSGKVSVYQKSNGVWDTDTPVLTVSGPTTGAEFGTSVSLSADGQRLAVGAPVFATSGSNQPGRLAIYEQVNGTWSSTPIATFNGVAHRDRLGGAVSISSDGTVVAVGAEGRDANGSSSGEVRVYKEVNGAWSSTPVLNAFGTATSDQLGISVSLSGDGTRLIAGAEGSGTPGKALIFEETGGTWSTSPVATFLGEANDDEYGASVSFSADGARVAVGATDHAGQAGQVKVFEQVDGSWSDTPVIEFDGDAAGDEFGKEIALSADGGRIIIGAPFKDSEEPGLSASQRANFGQAQIFEIAVEEPAPDVAFIDGQGFPSISAAIQAAAAGDVVLIMSGVYMEGIDLTGKDITIQIGANPE